MTAVIAAFNEETSIGGVLTSLTTSPLIDEVIVVSDGSTDATVEISRQFDVCTVALRENQGKGYAMRLGVEHASNDILFFVDGDILDLTHEHIAALVEPVVSGRCDMNAGVRHRGPIRDFLHLKLHFGPVLTGIRVLRRDVFETVPLQYQERFKIELALNFFSARAGFRQINTVLFDLGHIVKEQKRGVAAGLASRWTMCREVFLLHFDLYGVQSWRWNGPSDRRAEYELFESAPIGD